MLCQWPGCRQHLGHPLVSDDKYASEQLEKAGVGVEGPQLAWEVLGAGT